MTLRFPGVAESLISSTVPARALAVFAHPDDPEVACGGALARWARGGTEVHMVIANRGDKGSLDPSTDPEALSKRRAGEVSRAAAVLGLAAVEQFGYPDGEIDNDVELRNRLTRMFRDVAPDTIVAPDPTAVFFGDSYVNHRDHRELGWAVLDSLVPAATPLYAPAAGRAHQVSTVLLSGTLEPNTWVDVSDVFDIKMAAVACHQSQLGDDPTTVLGLLDQRAAEEGSRVGVSHAEAFRRLRLGG